ncbi:helix-turn-helix domain-containing protein [Streptomyces sp. NPDC005122]
MAAFIRHKTAIRHTIKALTCDVAAWRTWRIPQEREPGGSSRLEGAETVTGDQTHKLSVVRAGVVLDESDFDLTLLAVTVEEAARRLSIGRTTMYALIRDGAVRTVPIGRSRRVPVQALADYLAQRMQSRSTNAVA